MPGCVNKVLCWLYTIRGGSTWFNNGDHWPLFEWWSATVCNGSNHDGAPWAPPIPSEASRCHAAGPSLGSREATEQLAPLSIQKGMNESECERKWAEFDWFWVVLVWFSPLFSCACCSFSEPQTRLVQEFCLSVMCVWFKKYNKLEARKQIGDWATALLIDEYILSSSDYRDNCTTSIVVSIVLSNLVYTCL